MVKISIVGNGCERYQIVAPCKCLGRRWDNRAEKIEIVKPQSEEGSSCLMVVSFMGQTVEHIIVGDEPVDVTSAISQYDSVEIGFSFSRSDGYVKNSEVETFSFLEAQKPDAFVAETAEQSKTIEKLMCCGFVTVGWKAGAHNTLEFKNMEGEVAGEIELSGFTQEQADLGEIDNTKETFVKGKKTSNLLNDGDGTSPFLTEEKAKNLHQNMDNYYNKQEIDDIIAELPTPEVSAEDLETVDINARKILILGANGTIGTIANFEVEDAESYLPYRNNLTEFIFSGIIPVSGEVDLTKEVTITFGDTSYYLFDAVNTTKKLTLRDLDFALRESLVTGYNYLFRTVFFENADAVGFAVLPDKEDVLSLNSDQMDNYMIDGGLPQGQLAICNEVTVNGYTLGGIYRFKITYPSTYEWEELVPSRLGELTLNQNGSVLTSTQTFNGHIHAMIEFDTDGVHYGADFVLHPCDSAICLVSYRFGVHDGTAYLDDSGHINISIPDGLTFTSFKGHYIKL